MIAERLGVLSGSLYSHIAGKDQVLCEIVVDVADDFLARAAAVRARGEEPAATLRALCRAHLDVLHERQAAVTVYYDEWRKLGAQDRTRITALRERYEGHFAATIAEGVDAGAFGPVDVRSTVYVLLSSCNWTYQWYSPGGSLPPHAIADGYVGVVLSGLAPAASSTAPERTSSSAASIRG
jgi:AcrR family transcriptional regulator